MVKIKVTPGPADGDALAPRKSAAEMLTTGFNIYTFIHYKSNKYMKTIRNRNNRQKKYKYVHDRQRHRQTERKIMIVTKNSKLVTHIIT